MGEEGEVLDPIGMGVGGECVEVGELHCMHHHNAGVLPTAEEQVRISEAWLEGLKKVEVIEFSLP